MLKLQLYNGIYRLPFFSNSLIHILSLSNSHNNVASIQKNRDDKSHRVIVALDSEPSTFLLVKVIGIRPLPPVQNSVSLKLSQGKPLNFVINLPDVENITK